PYVGADVSPTLVYGFEYRFDDMLREHTIDKGKAVKLADGRVVSRNEREMCAACVRIRLQLSAWSESMLSNDLSYLRAGEDQIRNTLNGPDVRTVPEDIWMISAKFAVRIGL